MKIIAIDEVIKHISALRGQTIFIEGFLHSNLDGDYIAGEPQSQLLNEDLTSSDPTESIYNKAISIYPAPSTNIDQGTFSKYSNKKAIVGGTVYDHYSGLAACGHINLWAGELAVTEIRIFDFSTDTTETSGN